MIRFLALALAAIVVSAPVWGDTAYVKPSTSSPEIGQRITVEVAFNDVCCEPRYPVRTDTFVIVSSDGNARKPERIDNFVSQTILETDVVSKGTTVISTGERLGRKGEYVFLNGVYHLINSRDAEPIEIPDNTPILTSQTATVSKAYISVGKPNWDVIHSASERLQIIPATHPNMIEREDVFRGVIKFDDKPVSGQKVVLNTEQQRLEGMDETVVLTDVNGVFELPMNHGGGAQIWVRMQALAPDGASTDIRSYTTALTVLVGNE